MASSGEDEYGELDDDDMIMIATQAEDREILPSADRAWKRRKLSDRAELDSEGEYLNKNKDIQSHGRSLAMGRVSPIAEGGDEDRFHRAVPPPRNKTKKRPEDEIATPKKKPKSKYRIHIPKQAEVPKDAFFTQPPPSSSSPYRIRGPRWQKLKKLPATQSPSCKSIEGRSKINHKSADTSRPSIIQSSDEEDAFDPSPHPIRVSGEIPDDLADLSSDAFDPSPHPIRVSGESLIELTDLPSEALASSSPSKASAADKAIYISSRQQPSQHQRLVGAQANLRQTTLFGSTTQKLAPASQITMRHNWPLATKEEPPTHHKLDRDGLKTWVYPTNLGTIRDYQYNIVQRGLYHNLLVALPTGLGKTFIAATVMLNWFRWTINSQIFFVAPTKPLVSQQVEACFNIAGIPRSATTMLTGETGSRLRSEEYLTKRVFFMTPQTLMNDLGNGNCDPKKLVLLVVDEAHRATGNYAYVKIVSLLRRFTTSFRVLALTATPGASVETVQAVIDGLEISRVEIRTESSIDIRQYVHSRKIDTQVFEYSEEMEMLMGLWAKSLQPVLNKLNWMNAYWAKDPMTLTPYGMTKARQAWLGSGAGQKASMGVKAMVNAIFTLLSSLAQATELLKYHGIGTFYHNLLGFRNATEKSGKYRKQVIESEHFQKLMTSVQRWITNPDFVGHPKLEYLRTVVLNHFLDAGEGGETNNATTSSTRIMVFVHFRDSAEEVARVLKRHEPMIRPHVFVGQANAKGSDGMDQRKQSEIVDKFKKGVYNTIVATSIGEEGLDIGEVDLIICYDSSASPIRMLQRMGRTGRKRAGNIVVLLMRGKEENSFTQAKDNYEKMQHMIAEGSRFSFHEDKSTRIVPKDIHPMVEKKVIEIPLENTQPGLPEPKRRAKPSKKPLKKFHIPEGARTGFVKASRLKDGEEESDNGTEEAEQDKTGLPSMRQPTPDLESIPALPDVLLNAAEEKELGRAYLDVGGEIPQMVEVPRVDAFPALQRSLGRTKHLSHGRATERLVKMLRTVHEMNGESIERFERNLHPNDKQAAEAQVAGRTVTPYATPTSSLESAELFDSLPPVDSPTRNLASAARRAKAPRSSPMDHTSSVGEDDDDNSLGGFVVDDLEDADDQGAISSVTSSPPPLDTPSKPFYIPLHKAYGSGSESEEDLPEISRLVEKTGFVSAATLTKADFGRGPVPVSSQRRSNRRVIEDESDDE
ncbi:MAG: 3'-5' DNA helicase [Pleopsidium flavum]|nr:MAG: 3'-5' DNA helicase [Pleopsidium flavum]